MGESDWSILDGMSVTPEPGWVLHTPHGTARCGDGPDDYLVRLADVVRWFQNKHRLPFAVAVGRVIDRISVDSFQQMFFMDEQGWARPMWEPSPWDEFAMTPEEKALPYLEGRVLHCIRGLRSAWLMPVWEAEKFFNTGRPAGEPPEYDKERETVFEFIDRKGGSGAVSAVRMRVAHELWGWGRVVAAVAQPDTVAETTPAPAIETQDVTDWPSLVRYHKRLCESPAAWPAVWRRIALEFHESVRRAARGPTTKKRMAEALGISRDTVNTLLNDAREERAEEADGRWMLAAVVNGN